MSFVIEDSELLSFLIGREREFVCMSEREREREREGERERERDQTILSSI